MTRREKLEVMILGWGLHHLDVGWRMASRCDVNVYCQSGFSNDDAGTGEVVGFLG